MLIKKIVWYWSLAAHYFNITINEWHLDILLNFVKYLFFLWRFALGAVFLKDVN